MYGVGASVFCQGKNEWQMIIELLSKVNVIDDNDCGEACKITEKVGNLEEIESAEKLYCV